MARMVGDHPPRWQWWPKMTIEDDINEVKARYPHAVCRYRLPVIIIHGLDEGIIGEGQTSAEAWAHAARQVARDTQR